jgi:hypothetical protein
VRQYDCRRQGDKAYDSDAFRKSLRRDGIKPVIPGRANRKNRIRYDREAFQAHRNALRQTRQKLLFQRMSCRRRRLLDMT